MPDTKTNSAIPTLPISAMKPVSAKTPTRTHKSTTHPKSFQHPNDYIVMPAAQDHSQNTTFSATKSFLDTPSWLKIVCGISLSLMANQLNLAPSGILHKLYLSDIAFLLAIIPIVFFLLRKPHRYIHLPLLCLLPVIVVSISNFFTGTGLGGVVESCQTAATFIGGTVLFAFMLRYMPLTALLGVTIGLVLNLLAASIQDILYGAFITIAPKDIMELPYGIGKSMTGLFRSKIAFSCYVTIILSWIIPLWLSAPFSSRTQRTYRLTLCFFLVLWGICMIPHAMFAILASVITIVSAFAIRRPKGVIIACGVFLAFLAVLFIPAQLHYESWKATVSPLKGYNYVPDASILFNQPSPVQSSEPSPFANQLKSCHYELIAALRLAASQPLCGVGSGNYQKEIGAAYSLNEDRNWCQLPVQRINDIETDSQAGWGILAATIGFPGLIAIAYFLLAALGKNLKRIHDDMEDGFFLHIGGAASLTAFILVMFLCDPTIRGLCWFLALALASAETGPVMRLSSIHLNWNIFTRIRLVELFVIAMLFIACIPAGSAINSRMKNQCQKNPKQATPACKPVKKSSETTSESLETATPPSVVPEASNTPPAPNLPAADASKTASEPLAATTAPAATEAPLPPQAVIAEDSDELFVVFNADKATDITMPMRKEDDDSD
ncbi:MAG: hypothetical protein J6X55_01785, partial [Victivallales bacterium]|nr:hypothetical protein [Victivallales bacterium]